MSDVSDNEVPEKADEKDADFRIEDYRNEIDSDDSYCDADATNKDDDEPEENQEELEEEEKTEYIGPILPGGHRFDKKFICIKYPGNVINADRAIETLGGIAAVSTAVNASNRRLELRFRPDDCYCKPACGDRHKTTAFLLRVRVKKSRVEKANESEKGKESRHKSAARISVSQNASDTSNRESTENLSTASQADTQNDIIKSNSQRDGFITSLVNQVQSCSVNDLSEPFDRGLPSKLIKDLQDVSLDNDESSSRNKKNIPPTFDRNKYEDLSKDEDYVLPKLKILGRVDTEFRFINLCDFQYLPLTQTKEDPKKLECLYNFIYPNNMPHCTWLKNKVPYFLPPAAFSRMDTVQHYVPKTEVDSLPENIIGKNKKRRAGFSNFIYFSTPEVPAKPPPGIETALKVKFVQDVHLAQIRQLFEERPIWSKNAIMYKTRFSLDRLKILMPSVAYYFMTGPWKIMWVRLGYDPRKDVSARKYQTLDYRLKAMHGLGSTVKCKRNYSDYTLPYKSAPVSKQKTTILSATMSQEQSQKKEQNFNENVYVYREGTVPPSRQMFYQYCDVLVDEIQEMLAKLPDPQPGVRCHEKRGWLPSGFDAQCREIINKQVRAVLRKRMNIPEDHPTSLPRKRKRGIRIRRQQLRNKRQKKSDPPVIEGPSVLRENAVEQNDEAGPSTKENDDVAGPSTKENDD